MNPVAQPQLKRCEETIQELDEALHLLNWKMSKIEVRLHTALEQMNAVDLSTS
jgi:hypothetical protein